MIELAPDCARCAALCCRLSSFERSSDFSFSKRAGEACRYLTPRDACAVHARRVELGLAGCAAFDCHGAGQALTARLTGGESLGVAVAAFSALLEVHYALRLVELAERLGHAERVAALKRRLVSYAALTPSALAELDTSGLRVVLPRRGGAR